MAKKIRLGDIVEIPTARGIAYAQLCNTHPQYGALIRVLPGFFDARPSDFGDVACQPEKFVTFFPLQAAVNRKIVEIVGNASVPEFARAFPLFRSGVEDPATRKVKLWWFWDGEKEWRVGDITLEQRKMPLRGIWNDTLLVERIEAGWTPSSDPT